MGIPEKLIITRKVPQGKEEEIRWPQRANYWNIACVSVCFGEEGGGEGSHCALTHCVWMNEWMNEWKPPNRIQRLKYHPIPRSRTPSLPPSSAAGGTFPLKQLKEEITTIKAQVSTSPRTYEEWEQTVTGTDINHWHPSTIIHSCLFPTSTRPWVTYQFTYGMKRGSH